MTIVWTECLTLRLVALYSQYECLRNPFHPNFENKLYCYKVYKEIVDCMNVCGLTVDDCIKRITCIKAQYCYELSKISAAISCEKFYKPTVSWFPIVHKLFFPHVDFHTCTNCLWEICSCETDLCKDYQCSETDSDSVDAITPSRNCNKLCKIKLRARHKTPCIHTEGDKCITPSSTATDGITHFITPRPQKVIRVDVGNNTRRNINEEHATQTDISYFKTICNTCQYMESDIPVNCMKLGMTITNKTKGANCIEDFMAEDDAKKDTTHDEFDMFGKSIAFQLRNINFGIAVRLEKRIQNLIAQERLDDMKLKCSDCDSVCSCSQCKIFRKDMICSCGFPIIMIKADSSCDLDCERNT